MAQSDEDQKWQAVKAMLDAAPVSLGPYFSFLIRKTPRRLLHLLSYYKFAAKMIGAGKRVVDVGCSEGLGSILLAEQSVWCLGCDIDADGIAVANASVGSDKLRFQVHDVLATPLPDCDASVSFDTIEHIPQDKEDQFVAALAGCLGPHGICVIGTPNETSDKYASPWTRAGHINLYSGERLRDLCQKHFHAVFLFSGNDEVVHTGFSPMAHYLIVMCVGPKR